MTRPVLLPTSLQDETFGGLTYHLDGELVPVLTVDIAATFGLFRAPHPSLEEPYDQHRHPAGCGSLPEIHGRDADLCHRGQRTRTDLVQS